MTLSMQINILKTFQTAQRKLVAHSSWISRLEPDQGHLGIYEAVLKTYYKPSNQQELKDGIESFWVTLKLHVCQQYIDHITKKVMPNIVSVQGDSSGY